MSDFKPPKLPSDKELGLSKKEIEELEADFPDDGPEMTEAEMTALFGESPALKPIDIPMPKIPVERPKAKAGPATTPAGGAGEAGSTAAGGAPAAEAPSAGAGPQATKETNAKAPKAPKPPKTPKERLPRPALVEGPRSRWRGAVTLLFLVGAAVFSSTRTGQPRPVPANAPDTVFSSARAMTMLVDIAREAHPTGSPEHARVRQYLVDRLTALGLEPEVQTTTSMIQNGSGVRSATVRNVVARMSGTDSEGAVLVTAHYDSREIAQGAGDDGSGVVAILEALRASQERGPLKNDLIVLFTDSEELGLLGARAFVDEHRWMVDVRLALSFEMRGGAGPSIMFETGPDNGWVIGAFQASHPHPFANSMALEIYKRLPNDTDFSPFLDAGVQGLNFAGIDNAHVYHQEFDTPENFSESTLQHQGLNALSTIRHFGDQDLTSVDAPDATYLSFPVAGLVAYDAKWITPISGGLIALLLLAVGLAARGGWGFRGILIGLFMSVFGGGVAYGMALALAEWLPGFHPEVGSLHGSAFHSEGWYILALAAGSLTIVTALHGIARRWIRAEDLALGALHLPLIIAVAVGSVAPLAAINLQWPVAAALVSTTIGLLLGARSQGTVGWLASMLFALPVLLVMVPLTELIWLALNINVAAILAVLMVIGLYLALPALEGLRHPNSWWAPLTGLVVGGASLGMGILAARPSADRPAPSTLVYAFEHGTTQALWATDPSTDSLDLPAHVWAARLAGSDFEQMRDLSDFGYPDGEVPVTSAPTVDASPPSVVVERDTTFDGARHVTLSVRSQIGAEMLRFQYPEGGTTRLLSINGKTISSPETMRWADHWGVPDSTVLLGLEMPAEATIQLDIIEHLLRPEELLGADAFARPEELAPDINRLSDRAMFKYRAALVDPRYTPPAPGTGSEARTTDTGVPALETDDATTAPGGGVAPAGGTATPGAGPATPVDTVVVTDTVVVRDTVFVTDTVIGTLTETVTFEPGAVRR